MSRPARAPETALPPGAGQDYSSGAAAEEAAGTERPGRVPATLAAAPLLRRGASAASTLSGGAGFTPTPYNGSCLVGFRVWLLKEDVIFFFFSFFFYDLKKRKEPHSKLGQRSATICPHVDTSEGKGS